MMTTIIVTAKLPVKSFNTSSSNASQRRKYFFMYIIKYNAVTLIKQDTDTISLQPDIQILTREANLLNTLRPS